MYDQIPSQFVDEFARWSAKERIYIIHLVRAATVLKMASHEQTIRGHMHATTAAELALARRKIQKDGNLIAWGCAKKTTFEDYPFIDESAKRNAARYGQSIRMSPKVILDICDREAVNRHAQEQWDILLELQPGVNYFEIMYEKLLGRTADTYLREILTFLGITAQVQSPMQHHRDAHAEDAFTKLHESQCGSRFANYSGLLKALAGTRTAAACKFLDAIEEQLELVPTPPSRSNYFATEASQVWHPGVKTPAKTLQWWLLDTRAPHMACYAPKTGSTIWKALMLYVNTGRNLYRSLRTNPGLVHESSCPGLCESATYRNDAKSAYFDSLPKVIIVRNPYDRFLSSYQDWLSRQQEMETSVSFGDFVSAVERRDLKGALWNHIDPVSNACGLPGTLNPVPGAYRILRLEEFSLWIEDYIEKFDVKFFLRRLILDLEENSTNRFADSVMNESTTVFSKFEGVLEEKPWSLLEMATTSHMRNSAGNRFNFYTPDIAARVSKLQNADFVHFGYPLWDGLPGSFRTIEEQSDLVPTPQVSSTFRPAKGAADAFAVRTSRSAGSGDDGDSDGSGSGSGSEFVDSEDGEEGEIQVGGNENTGNAVDIALDNLEAAKAAADAAGCRTPRTPVDSEDGEEGGVRGNENAGESMQSDECMRLLADVQDAQAAYDAALEMNALKHLGYIGGGITVLVVINYGLSPNQRDFELYFIVLGGLLDATTDALYLSFETFESDALKFAAIGILALPITIVALAFCRERGGV